MALYLSPEWAADPTRCRAAGVPEGRLTYQSKAQLALALLSQARQRGQLAGQWVAADADDGKVPTFRDALDGAGWWYVLEVPCTMTAFERLAQTEVRTWVGNGRPPTQVQLLPGEPEALTVERLAAQLSASAWQALTVTEGALGPRTYQLAARRVWECRDGVPGRACWLVWGCNLDGSEFKYYFSNAPADTPLLKLGQIGAARWTIETEFQTEKGETGLDEYEARSWQSWHRHITVALWRVHSYSVLSRNGGTTCPRSPARK